jgi:hypothetical protein
VCPGERPPAAGGGPRHFGRYVHSRNRRVVVGGVSTSSPRLRTLLLAACAALVAGCGTGPPTAGPEVGVSVDEVQEDQPYFEGEYLGERVVVSAEVTDVLDPRHLELAGGEYGEDSLLVRTAGPVEVRQGEVVRVAGTVGQYQRFLESEGVPPVQYDMYEEYETEAYLYDAEVEVLASPPPGG